MSIQFQIILISILLEKFTETNMSKQMEDNEMPMMDVLTPYGKALQSVTLIGTEEYWRMHYAGLAMQANINLQIISDFSNLAKESFRIADAMIEKSKEK